MILFLGCSLTWGQGLQIEKWLSEGKSIEFCNEHTEPHYSLEFMNYEDDEFRKSKAYPNLVAKELNVSYSTKWGNGGTNDEILFIIENIDKLIHPAGLDLIVIQFTDMVRDDMFQHIYQNNSYDLVEIHLKNQINKIDYTLAKKSIDIPWISLCWHKEHSDFLKQKYPKNFIKLHYDNNQFDNIQSLNSYAKEVEGKSIELCDIYKGIEDGHPSSIWHQTISDSIIRKIKEEKIEFKKYNS